MSDRQGGSSAQPSPPRRASCRPRPTSRRSSPTVSAARSASTCPDTRAAPAPIPGCAARSASARWRSTSARTSRASTSVRRRPRTSAPSSSPPAAYGAGADLVSDQRSHPGQPRAVPGAAKPDQHVLVQRNSHASVVDGLVLSGGVASFVAPEYDEELGMAHGVTPEALGRGAARVRRRCSGVHRLADLLRDGGRHRGLRRGRPRGRRGARRRLRLGLALRLSPALPESPLSQGADAVLASTHKIVGSLTQSAMLHVAAGGLVDPDEVARCVRLVRSTSPNSLLLASLDSARRQLAAHGEALLDRTLAAAARARGDRRDPGLLGGRRGDGRSARDRRLGPAADRDRHPWHGLHRV